MTDIMTSRQWYAQIGEDHPNSGYGGNVEIFYEYEPDGGGTPITAYPNVIPSGNVEYQVWRDWLDGGMEFQWNNTQYYVSNVNFSPTEIQNAGEIWDYQHVSGGTSLGDAAMGDKSHHVYSNSVAWLDTSYGVHWASLGYNNTWSNRADYQTFASTNGNNWSQWDNRCG